MAGTNAQADIVGEDRERKKGAGAWKLQTLTTDHCQKYSAKTRVQTAIRKVREHKQLTPA